VAVLEAQEGLKCPIFPDRVVLGFDDPAHATGSEEEIRREFRRVRDEIALVFRAYAAGWQEGRTTQAF